MSESFDAEEILLEMAEEISELGVEGFEEKEGWVWTFDEEEESGERKTKKFVPGVGEVFEQVGLGDVSTKELLAEDQDFKAIRTQRQAWQFTTSFIKQLYIRSIFGEENPMDVAEELIEDAKQEKPKLKAYSLILKPDIENGFDEELTIDDDFELKKVSKKEAEVLYNSLRGGLVKERLGDYLASGGEGYFYVFEKKFSQLQDEDGSPTEGVKHYSDMVIDKASDFDAALLLNGVEDVSHSSFQFLNQATKSWIYSVQHNLTFEEEIWTLGKHYSEEIRDSLETYNQIAQQEKSRDDGLNLALRRLLSAKRKDNIEDILLDLCIAVEAIASIGREDRFDWSVRIALALERPEIISELDNLWDKRNDIAHGNYQEIEREDIETLLQILIDYLNKELEFSSENEQSLKDHLEIKRVSMTRQDKDNSEVERKVKDILQRSD